MSVKKAVFWIFLLLEQCLFIFACGGTYTTDTGVITSPNYPYDYNNNDNCVWTITVDSGKTITLSFTDFHLEYGILVYRDYVEVRDGSSSFSDLIGQYDGDLIPDSITTTGNSVYVKFISDVSLTYSGFRATWSTDETCTLCSWSSWNSYGSCNGTCGGGSRTRSRPLCCGSYWDFDFCLSYCALDLSGHYSTSVCTRQCNNGGTASGATCLCRPGYTGTCCDTAQSTQPSTTTAATTTKTTTKSTTKTTTKTTTELTTKKPTPTDVVPTRKPAIQSSYTASTTSTISIRTTPHSSSNVVETTNAIIESKQSNSTILIGGGVGSGLLVLIISILIVIAVLLKRNNNNNSRIASPANAIAMTTMSAATVDGPSKESPKEDAIYDIIDLVNTEEDGNAYSYAMQPVKKKLNYSTEYYNLGSDEMSESQDNKHKPVCLSRDDTADTQDGKGVGSEAFKKSDHDSNYYYS